MSRVNWPLSITRLATTAENNSYNLLLNLVKDTFIYLRD